ncbi:TIGR03085 family metal-binding protein [Janibacter sp. GXQ6167]|uniref:TIGR03085 family metal-binding protein n=1 Tax=Janibacter sp. GXQ6167 TaxID=3240791 RepID=UPI00352400EE
MSRPARAERLALADTLEEYGPNAPTLCGDWTTAELAAHLVIRERRPLTAAGIMIPFLAERTDRETRQLAATTPFEELVDLIRSGPPAWHPAHLGVIDDQMNLIEMFVHHEDILRASDPSARRPLSLPFRDALWKRLRLMAKMLYGKSPVAVRLLGSRGTLTAKGSGDGQVDVHGSPGELILFGFGRQQVAGVELIGQPAAIEQLRTAPLGI